MLHLRMEGYFNSLFAHFMAFSREFDLIERKEMKELQELIEKLEAAGRLT